jgi:ATP-binding cassette subfamily C exporter for protease/lipase
MIVNLFKIFRDSYIFALVATFKKEIWALIILSSITNILMLTPTIYMLQIFDRVMISKSEFSLLSISLIVLFLYAIQAASEWFRSHILIAVGGKIDEVLNEPVFYASFKEQLAGVNKNPLQIFSDLNIIRQWLTGAGVFSFFDLPWTPIYMVVMFMLHPILGITTIVFMLILAGIAYFNTCYSKDLVDDSLEEERELNSFIYAKLKNAEVIEAHGMVPNLMKKWLEKQKIMYFTQFQSKAVEENVNSISRNFRIILQSLALGIGALLAIEGEISMGAMIAASLLIGRATSPIDGIVAGWSSLKRVQDSFIRIESLIKTYPIKTDGHVLDITGRVNIKDVTVKVDSRPNPILKEINLEMPPGMIHGIIGPSGAGKTTLGKIIVGAWPGFSGDVNFDGYSIADLDRDYLGPQIGYMPQTIELFAGSVAQNIARMSENLDADLVIKASQMAGIHQMILRFEQGYDTQIGPSGSYLSGGQRQRVALARALYGLPKVIVLDEPNANLDEAGNQALVSAIKSAKESGSSIFLITHRPEILRIVDRVIYVNEGRVKGYETRESFFSRIKS